MARGARGLETDVTGSINGEALTFLGAQNIVPAGVSAGNLADVSLEQVLAWQPDVIVTIDRNFFAGVLTDPQWQGVKAVRDKRVYLAPLNPFGWVDEPPGPNRLIGLRWLAHLLYPQLFLGISAPRPNVSMSSSITKPRPTPNSTSSSVLRGNSGFAVLLGIALAALALLALVALAVGAYPVSLSEIASALPCAARR